MTRNLLLSVVIPIFREEAVLPELLRRTNSALEKINSPYEIICVDDGSDDGSPGILDEAVQHNPRMRVIRLSRNFGLQPAVTAGLCHAHGDIIGLMDGDLQDPPELIPEMLQKIQEGYDVVYMLKRSRKDTFLRRLGFNTFYWLFQRLSYTPIPSTAGLFSLMRRRVVDAILTCSEKNKFVPGLRAWVGFSQTGMEFDREARFAGEPRQTMGRLLRLAFDALYSFTDIPLKLAMFIGLTSSFLSFLAIIIVSSLRIFTDLAISGWASTLVAIFFMGGVQLICVGILGEYISRIHKEVQGRPLFIVEKVIEHQDKDERHGLQSPSTTC